jgi:hypothetical protein
MTFVFLNTCPHVYPYLHINICADVPINSVSYTPICAISLSLTHTYTQKEIRNINMDAKEVEVTVIKKEVVAANSKLSKTDQWLPLSNLDLCILRPLDFSLFFCYNKPTCNDNWTFVAMVEILKKALEEALVPYYALAGEVVLNSAVEPKLICNNRGVDFIEAFADTELRMLNLFKPDETIGCKLVPKKKNGVLAVQVCKCFKKLMGYYFENTLLKASN